jgi:hypothetical protein
VRLKNNKKEENKMRKLLITSFVLLLSLVMMHGVSYAVVGGQCSNCHTMHNSQGGADVIGTGPYGRLLNNTCIGCHTTTGTDPLDADGKPFVRSSNATGFDNDNSLAGGFFQATDSTGSHDDEAHSLGNTNDPAGLDAAENSWYSGGTDGLSSAGTNGCHGDETILDDMAAISGGHHSATTYRILYVGGTGVVGTGAADYEEDLIATAANGATDAAHNIYSAGANDPSISELCAKCHSDFHGDDDVSLNDDGASPWTRHPTDEDIPTTWTIVVSGDDELDWKYNPVGYDNATTTNPERVICVSCHRAHGTDQNDNLRFAYSTQDAGGGSIYGCLGCHNAQR